MRVLCEHCHAIYSLSGEFVGKQAKCTQCKQLFVIRPMPTPEPPLPEAAADTAASRRSGRLGLRLLGVVFGPPGVGLVLYLLMLVLLLVGVCNLDSPWASPCIFLPLFFGLGFICVGAYGSARIYGRGDNYSAFSVIVSLLVPFHPLPSYVGKEHHLFRKPLYHMLRGIVLVGLGMAIVLLNRDVFKAT